MVTHFTPRDVLYELCKVTSGAKRRDSCSCNLLLSNAPESSWQYALKNGAQVEVESAHEAWPLWCLQNTLPLFMPLAATIFGAMSRNYHVCILSCVHSPSSSVITRTELRQLFEEINSAVIRGGIASHRNILVFPCSINAESSSAQRYKVRNLFLN